MGSAAVLPLDSGWVGMAEAVAGAYYGFWATYGEISISYGGEIICTSCTKECVKDEDCIATHSASGTYAENDGTASVGVQAGVSGSGNVITVNFSAGIAHSGSNAVGAGVGPIAGGISFPSSGVSKTMAMGSATWKCECK
jgi:hypothetical protein